MHGGRELRSGRDIDNDNDDFVDRRRFARSVLSPTTGARVRDMALQVALEATVLAPKTMRAVGTMDHQHAESIILGGIPPSTAPSSKEGLGMESKCV
jgi:hypothetical protein